MKLYGLADCNNFFCSCERVFRPDLRNKPIIVLSNNDGCVVARSNESKALGIKMGDPYFQIKKELEKHNVTVFSSNLTLYGDMSSRVMSTLSKYTPQIDIYSIDEAFIDLTGIVNPVELCSDIIKHINKGIGIPVSIGIAPTKTLAKIASKFAKTYKGYKGVCLIDSDEKRIKALKLLDISDVWGIGRKSSAKLKTYGVKTAYDFTQKPQWWIQQEFSINGVKTWRELKGEDCIDSDELPFKKSLCTSRSFADMGLNKLSDIEEAIADFAANCSRKLVEQNAVCKSLSIFAYGSRFREDIPNNNIHINIILPIASNNIQTLVSACVKTLRNNWKEGNFWYKKIGVVAWDITRSDAIQTSLFEKSNIIKDKKLSKVINEINNKSGKDTIRIATQSNIISERIKNQHHSPHYTTDINQILIVKS